MKFLKLYTLPLLTAALCGCDEGRIADVVIETARDGMAAHVRVSTEGAESWSKDYTIAVAGFADGNEYALISKNAQIGADGLCDVVLTGIPVEASTVEVCAIDRLRRRVASFASVQCNPSADTIRLEDSKVDLHMSGAIQREIFNTTCTQCHGGSGFAAAGLNLTAGQSMTQLIGVESTKQPGMLRVTPGASDASVLYRILSTTESAAWSYDHSVEVVAQERLELIKNWIDDLQ